MLPRVGLDAHALGKGHPVVGQPEIIPKLHHHPPPLRTLERNLAPLGRPLMRTGGWFATLSTRHSSVGLGLATSVLSASPWPAAPEPSGPYRKHTMQCGSLRPPLLLPLAAECPVSP